MASSWCDGAILALRGAIDRRPRRRSQPDRQRADSARRAGRPLHATVRIRVDESSCAENVITNLHEILRGYPGTCEVELALILADGTKLLLKSNRRAWNLRGTAHSRR